MDCSLNADEKRRYLAWLHSPSVHGPDENELILAYKIARKFKAVPSKSLKALRGIEGVDPALVSKLERFVEEEPGLTFTHDASIRRVALAPVLDEPGQSSRPSAAPGT